MELAKPLYQMANIKSPVRTQATMQTSAVYPFKDLVEQQSFIVPVSDAHLFPRVRSAASYYARKHGIFIRCYTMENGDLQVYRDLDSSGKQGGGRTTAQGASLPVQPISIVPKPAALPRPSDSLHQMELPIGERIVEVPAGPTQQQWHQMLERMDVGEEITIADIYQLSFPQMTAWTVDGIPGAVNRRYTTQILVGNVLQVKRERDTMMDLQPVNDAYIRNALEYQDGVEDEALPEVEMATAEQLSAAREAAKLSPNKDGWTALPCKTCFGVPAEGCVYCSGTGKYYDAAQDARITPSTTGDLAGIAASIAHLAKTRFGNDPDEKYDAK